MPPLDGNGARGSLMRLAIQLYTLRTIDAVEALPTLAAQGYQAVELYAPSDDPVELRRRLDDAGLEVCGWHVELERFDGAFDEVVEQARVLSVPTDVACDLAAVCGVADMNCIRKSSCSPSSARSSA